MNHNFRLAFIVLLIIIIATVGIGFNKIDPFFKTNITKTVIVHNVAYATGKSGARIELVLKEKNGETFIRQTTINTYRKGDKVVLRLYKRKFTGFQKYVLN